MTTLEMHPAMCGATWLVLVSTINSVFFLLLRLLKQTELGTFVGVCGMFYGAGGCWAGKGGLHEHQAVASALEMCFLFSRTASSPV